MSDKFTKIAVHILVRDSEGKILLHRRQNTWAAGKWDCPSGKLEYNELIEETAARELREETGLVCNEFKILGVNSLKEGVHKPTKQKVRSYIYIAVEALNWKGEPKIKEPEKCSEMRWFALEETKNLPLTPGAWFILTGLIKHRSQNLSICAI